MGIRGSYIEGQLVIREDKSSVRMKDRNRPVKT
jgi:hypothetical protein